MEVVTILASGQREYRPSRQVLDSHQENILVTCAVAERPLFIIQQRIHRQESQPFLHVGDALDLLCVHRIRILGLAGDSPRILQAAVRYIQAS